jgi:hypothetical protein
LYLDFLDNHKLQLVGAVIRGMGSFYDRA